MTRRWPAEWEPHAATLLTWPWDAEIWGPYHAGAVDAMAAAAAALSHGEDVIVHVPPGGEAAARAAIMRFGPRKKNLTLRELPSDDVWVRDHGPTLVVEDGALVAIDWRFDAWGKKFPHDRDAQIAAAAAAALGASVERASLTLEGGAIETDGRGTVLCTRSVALAANRNPTLSEADVDAELRARLGATEVIWLDAGMACDDTDGHIDTLARFIDASTVVVHVMADRSHPDAAVLDANRRALESLGRWRVVALEAPSIRDEDGEWLPASYANFYIANGRVLLPTYDAPEDITAMLTLSTLFRGRDVVPIPSRPLVAQGGAIHCATQQVPRV